MSQQKANVFDCIIIGAGPAGLNSGLHLIHSGKRISILLVDKMIPWEHPIPCAEGVGRLGFEEAIEVKSSWIRQKINRACFHAPGGGTICYTDKNGGYIIDRARMQSDIATELSSAGVECRYNCRVNQILPYENGLRKVLFQNNSSAFARVVIDASGPVCGFGKGEKIHWKPGDLEPAYFAVVENIHIEPDMIHIFAGKELAPGGYAWAFPRGENCANVGVVLGRKTEGHFNIRTLLDSFIEKFYPQVTIVRRFAGSIPCAFKHGPIALPGLIKTGDAASTINPISRAGISEALLSGGLAGDHAIEMLDEEKISSINRICKKYENEWNSKRGKRHFKLSKVKNSLLNVPDEDYNRGVELLSDISAENLTMSRIFKASLGRFPRLIWAMRHLM
jgi:digeranylgeranylglycerophospholipid reductase